MLARMLCAQIPWDATLHAYKWNPSHGTKSVRFHAPQGNFAGSLTLKTSACILYMHTVSACLVAERTYAKHSGHPHSHIHCSQKLYVDGGPSMPSLPSSGCSANFNFNLPLTIPGFPFPGLPSWSSGC